MTSSSSASCSYSSYADYSFKQDRLKKLPEIVAFADKLIDMVRKKGRKERGKKEVGTSRNAKEKGKRERREKGKSLCISGNEPTKKRKGERGKKV